MSLQTYHKLKEIIDNYPEFELFTDEVDSSAVLNSLTKNPMILDGLVEVRYDRSEGLLESFHEANKKPFFILSKNRKLLAIVNEWKVFINGKSETYIYTSDLRIDSNASARLRIQYRNCYKDIVSVFNSRIFTCILDDNKVAIKSLTKSKFFSYNNDLEYTAHSILITPSIPSFNSKKIHLIECQRQDIKMPSFFCIEDEAKVYSIKQEDQKNTLYTFSLFRTKNKKMKITPINFFIKLLIKSLSILMNKDYMSSVPFVYLTIIDKIENSNYNQAYNLITEKLKEEGFISNGEVIQIITRRDVTLNKLINVKTNGTMYSVTSSQKVEKEIDHFAISPTVI